MGRFEPPKRKTEAKRAGQRLKGLFVALTTSATLAGGAGVLNMVNSKPIHAYTLHVPHIEATVPYTPVTETTPVIQGTAPIADGNYIHLASVNPARTQEVIAKFKAQGFPVIRESVLEGKFDRLLVEYEPRDLHQRVEELSRIDRISPQLITKVNGVDQVRPYLPPPKTRHTLESYIQAANGRIELMPNYEHVSRAAEEMARELPFEKEELEMLIYAIKWQESRFDPSAKSRAGALGLMQVMPKTARWLGLRNTRQLYDPEDNIDIGSKALTHAIKYSMQANGNKPLEKIIPLAGAVYNAGEGNVRSGKYRHFKETQNYMRELPAHFRKLDAAF